MKITTDIVFLIISGYKIPVIENLGATLVCIRLKKKMKKQPNKLNKKTFLEICVTKDPFSYM